MTVEIESHPSLADDAVVYRTMDFFGAAQMIEERKLMFTRADKFLDKNEGIERMLRQLESARLGSGCGSGWYDGKTAFEFHSRIKNSYLVSCWTRTADSIAIWSLYSPDQCSVRVSTRVSKLKKPLSKILEKYCISKLSDESLGKDVFISVEGKIAPVEYVSLHEISNSIRKRAKAQIRMVERYKRNRKELPSLFEVDKKFFEREKKRRFEILDRHCLVKDVSFQYESEIRALVRIGEQNCTEDLLKIKDLIDPNHEHHKLLDVYRKAFGFVLSGNVPEREFADCEEGFIETVCIDPRCPQHKSKFIKNWFVDRGIKVVDSSCFGYIPDSFDVYPKKFNG